MPDFQLSPDPSHEQPVILPDIGFRDVNVAVAEIDEVSPILVIMGVIVDLHLVDEGMTSLLPYIGLGLVGFVRPHEIFRQSGMNDPHSSLDGQRVVRGAVFSQHVFQDEDGNVGPDFDFRHQVLADHLSPKDGRDFSIQNGHRISHSIRRSFRLRLSTLKSDVHRDALQPGQFQLADGIQNMHGNVLQALILGEHEGQGVRLTIPQTNLSRSLFKTVCGHGDRAHFLAVAAYGRTDPDFLGASDAVHAMVRGGDGEKARGDLRLFHDKLDRGGFQ